VPPEITPGVKGTPFAVTPVTPAVAIVPEPPPFGVTTTFKEALPKVPVPPPFKLITVFPAVGKAAPGGITPEIVVAFQAVSVAVTPPMVTLPAVAP